MSPDPCHLFLGDLHAGSSVAIMQDFTDHDGVRYGPSRVQGALLKFWKEALVTVKASAKGHDLVLHLGGDMVDGVCHHNSTQTVGDENDQIALAVQLLLPFANMSKMIYALLGTDVHVGQSGQADTSVAKKLGATADYRWRLETGGRVLDWAHHSGGSRLPWLLEGALIRLANKTFFECLERKQRPPDLIARHHTHQWCRTHAKGIDVFTVPGWKTQDSFTRRLDPSSLLTMGMVLWFPKTNEFRPLLFRFPDDPLQTVTFRKVNYETQSHTARRPG